MAKIKKEKATTEQIELKKPKVASNIFHNIMKASVTVPLKNKSKKS
jgi:hypothetical protein